MIVENAIPRRQEFKAIFLGNNSYNSGNRLFFSTKGFL